MKRGRNLKKVLSYFFYTISIVTCIYLCLSVFVIPLIYCTYFNQDKYEYHSGYVESVYFIEPSEKYGHYYTLVSFEGGKSVKLYCMNTDIPVKQNITIKYHRECGDKIPIPIDKYILDEWHYNN